MLILALGASGLPGIARAQEFKIQLDRPVKVGDKADVSVLGAGRWTTTLNVTGKDPQTQEEAFGVSLSGRLEAVEVDGKGNPTKVSVTIERCQKVTGSAQKDLLAKGDVLLAEMKEGKTGFSLKESGGVSPEVEKALQLVLDLHDPRLAGDDAMFGTQDAKKVGDSWNINPEVTAKDLNTVGLPVKAADITGKATLANSEKVDGVDSILVKAEFGVTKMQGDLPEGAKLEDGHLEGKYSTTLPVDPALQGTSEASSTKLTTVVAAKNPDGVEVKVQTTIDAAPKENTGR